MFERKVWLQLKDSDGYWVRYKKLKKSDWPQTEIDKLIKYTKVSEFRWEP